MSTKDRNDIFFVRFKRKQFIPQKMSWSRKLKSDKRENNFFYKRKVEIKNFSCPTAKCRTTTKCKKMPRFSFVFIFLFDFISSRQIAGFRVHFEMRECNRKSQKFTRSELNEDFYFRLLNFFPPFHLFASSCMCCWLVVWYALLHSFSLSLIVLSFCSNFRDDFSSSFFHLTNEIIRSLCHETVSFSFYLFIFSRHEKIVILKMVIWCDIVETSKSIWCDLI